jgi:hypothetical protein
VVAVVPIGTSHARSTPCRVFPSPPPVDFDREGRASARASASASAREASE